MRTALLVLIAPALLFAAAHPWTTGNYLGAGILAALAGLAGVGAVKVWRKLRQARSGQAEPVAVSGYDRDRAEQAGQPPAVVVGQSAYDRDRAEAAE
ncbi:hypothetical protein [Kitasatospora sp. McL0602]|uniref:hypothetical protein n=1 Tax=Kitasatospora sp. McL0602 TaxID=3439530 RepID=UPI003F8C163E